LKTDKPIVVPPGGTATCSVQFTVHGAGPFEDCFKLFLQDKGIRTVTVTVKGIGIAPGGSKHDIPTS
jgi:hypothetical protein